MNSQSQTNTLIWHLCGIAKAVDSKATFDAVSFQPNKSSWSTHQLEARRLWYRLVWLARDKILQYAQTRNDEGLLRLEKQISVCGMNMRSWHLPIPNRSATPGRYQTYRIIRNVSPPRDDECITGSTANLVTASSPPSLRQTLPSGILQQSARVTVWGSKKRTVGPPWHFVLTQEAVIWSASIMKPAMFKVTVMCARVIAW